MNLYGSTDKKINALEKAHYSLAREAAKEGIVLLRNRNILPLKNKNVALFGMGAVKTVAGGVGSGSVNQRYTVNIRQGLENSGFNITTGKYLDDCERDFEDSYTSWRKLMEEKTACLANPYMLFSTIGKFEFEYPVGRNIRNEDLTDDTDTAIYVIMRQAGEGNDRKPEKGDFLLSDAEYANIKKAASHYKHIIIVINVGGMIDLSFTDEIKNIDGIIYFSQAGMEGANALGELISGKANFSGKLADTWAKSYGDIPFGEEYGSLNGNLEREYYREGIFVGYRYFDTFNVEPRYRFGFGLSYTQFEINANKVSLDGTQAVVDLTVKNIGKQSGKEVVQIYVSHLNGGENEAEKQLVAFAKTKELKPDESVNIQLKFDMRDPAVYDGSCAQWVLKSGEYAVLSGNSSINLKCASVIAVENGCVTKKCKNVCVRQSAISGLKAPERKGKNFSDVPRIVFDTHSFKPEIYRYTENCKETSEEGAILDGLTVEETVRLVRGGDLLTIPKGSKILRGNGGKTTCELIEKGINNITFVDGPAGLNVFNHVYVADGMEYTVSLPERMNWTAIKKTMPPLPCGGVHVYRYATAWPVELVLAQTWNTDLLYKIGCAVGEEMTEFGVDVWLAPGLNIHRNPLCGRNFEYYSEDPFVTGKMAAAIIRGVQTFKNKGVAIKHFCCNNQEDNRFKVSSEADEDVLRQIYLKGFEIAVKEGAPKTVMSSYNKLNGIYTSNSKELLTDILRTEWGFGGLVMTDWGTCSEGQSDSAKCISAGNDLIMPGNNRDYEVILQAVSDGTLSVEQLRVCAARVLKLIKSSQ